MIKFYLTAVKTFDKKTNSVYNYSNEFQLGQVDSVGRIQRAGLAGNPLRLPIIETTRLN